jgi:hypothetical protein
MSVRRRRRRWQNTRRHTVTVCTLNTPSQTHTHTHTRAPDDTPDYRLQKRKKAFRRVDKPKYRIVTSNVRGHRFQVAHGDDLEHLLANEWRYCVETSKRIRANIARKVRSSNSRSLSIWRVLSSASTPPFRCARFSFSRLSSTTPLTRPIRSLACHKKQDRLQWLLAHHMQLAIANNPSESSTTTRPRSSLSDLRRAESTDHTDDELDNDDCVSVASSVASQEEKRLLADEYLANGATDFDDETDVETTPLHKSKPPPGSSFDDFQVRSQITLFDSVVIARFLVLSIAAHLPLLTNTHSLFLRFFVRRLPGKHAAAGATHADAARERNAVEGDDGTPQRARGRDAATGGGDAVASGQHDVIVVCARRRPGRVDDAELSLSVAVDGAARQRESLPRRRRQRGDSSRALLAHRAARHLGAVQRRGVQLLGAAHVPLFIDRQGVT